MSARDEVNLSLVDKMRFTAQTGSAHEITVDSSIDAGADDMGARPMELVLVALGSCMGMDTISILHKMRQDVTSYEIKVTGERATEHPRVFTTIAMMHRLRGPSLAEANVARALQLSISRYCPVYAMLDESVEISVTYELTDETTGAIETSEVERETPAPAETTRQGGS